METEKIAKNYRDYILRFNINYEEEEPVWCFKTPESWETLSSLPDDFQSELQYRIERLNGDSYGLYLASGTFRKGSIKRVGDKKVGRTEENLKRILEIPLDADYLKYILDQKGADKKEQIEELEKSLHGKPDDELSHALGIYLKFTKDILEKAKVPYSAIVRSGYGYYVKIFIENGDQTRIKEIRELHKGLVSYINDVAGFELFDKNCTDAGTRVTRIEGSYNLKNPDIPRLVHTVESNNQFYKLDHLIRTIPKREKSTSSHSDSDDHSSWDLKREEIIEILNPH